MSESQSLIERLREAKGPSREMDLEIARAIGIDPTSFRSVPAYTASLDAAMTLVPADRLAAWDIGYAHNGGPYYARVYLVQPNREAEVTHQNSAALALIIACLSARDSR